MQGFADRSLDWLNRLATIWALLLGFVILYDVISRLLGYSVQGTAEIVSNSVVAIVFMQFPLAVRDGALLRATVIYDRLPASSRRAVDAFGYVVGVLTFAAMGAGGWDDMITGWQIGEFEGEGALRVPVYPLRTIVIVLSFLSAAVFAVQFYFSVFGSRTGGRASPDDSMTTKARK